MSNLAIRTITGLTFALVMLGVVWAGKAFTFGLFFLAAMVGLYELFKLGGGEKHLSLYVLMGGGVVLSLLFFLFLYQWPAVSPYIFLLVPLLFLALAISTLQTHSRTPLIALGHTVGGLFYVIVGFFLAGFVSFSWPGWEPLYLTGFLLILWLNDSGAYIVGSLLGRTPLAPSLSPKKTWEGTSGGVLVALLVGLLLAEFSGVGGYFFWMGGAALIAIAGVLGDLFQSALKRNAGVKDSGNVLPGHGGVLDRYDAMLFAGPVFAIWVILVEII